MGSAAQAVLSRKLYSEEVDPLGCTASAEDGDQSLLAITLLKTCKQSLLPLDAIRQEAGAEIDHTHRLALMCGHSPGERKAGRVAEDIQIPVVLDGPGRTEEGKERPDWAVDFLHADGFTGADQVVLFRQKTDVNHSILR